MTALAARLQACRSGASRFVHRVRRLPTRDLLTTVRAGVVLAAVELTIRWVSLPRLSQLCGVRLDLTTVDQIGDPIAMDELPEQASRALRGTRRATALWPFCEGPCLRTALVGGHLIRRLDPAIRIGVAPAENSICAHAWLEVGGRPLEDVTDFSAFHRPHSASADRRGTP